MDKTGYLFAKLGDLSDVKADSEKKFFDNLTENHKDRTLGAERVRDSASEFATLQIAPTYCVCVMETSIGFELRSFEREERLQKMLRLLHEVLTELSVTQLARAGVRFFYLGQIAVTDAVATFGQQVGTGFRKAVNESIGPPTDFGIVIDGKSPANVKYQLKAGAYSAVEAPKYFDRATEAIAGRSGDNFIVDLDMYEEMTTLHVNPAKWASPLLSTADRLIGELKKVVSQEVDSDVTA
ncbi:hypothetical protein [Cupriavidus pauculus]|uniref:hypothetical protein n=1 Tax=Cupriavidus pauculus TaxID=82633 RepID=UPI001FD4E9DC|nr:hypothetical protein [Cupriavidus pauculus]